MTRLSKEAFKTTYSNPSGTFADNTSRQIGEGDLRQFGDDLADTFSDGVDWKKFVLAATTTTLPAYTASGGGMILTANANGAFPTIDTVTLIANDDVLVKDEGTLKYNGIYKLTQVGSGGTPWILTRRVDANTGELIQNAIVPVQKGSVNLGTIWKQYNSNTIVIDTNSIQFSRQSPPVYVTALETTNGEGSPYPPTADLVGAYTKRINLGSASILTGFSAPVDVTPTPDAGFVIVPIMFFVHLDYNSVAYATNTTFRFEINGVAVTATNSSILTGTADRFTTMIPIAYDTTTNLKAQPVKFKVQTGNPTAGNSPLYIVCIYKIVATGLIA